VSEPTGTGEPRGRPGARDRRDYQDGRLDADDWREQREQLTGELDAARAESERHAERDLSLASEKCAVDAEAAVLAELAAMRELVVGHARERSAEALDALRAALLRLFDRFELVTHPLVLEAGADDPLIHPTLLRGGEPDQWLRPYVRPDAITGWDDEARFPALRRAALSLGADITGSASPFSLFLEPIPVGPTLDHRKRAQIGFNRFRAPSEG
jgi:hypothetical protein